MKKQNSPSRSSASRMVAGHVTEDFHISPGRKFVGRFGNLRVDASDGDLETGQSCWVDNRAIVLRGTCQPETCPCKTPRGKGAARAKMALTL